MGDLTPGDRALLEASRKPSQHAFGLPADSKLSYSDGSVRRVVEGRLGHKGGFSWRTDARTGQRVLELLNVVEEDY
jgi:hypothetical protein